VFRKAQESQKEMKLLLDMYRSAPKEQRDKVQLMAAEKKAKAEVNYISLLFFFLACYLECICRYSAHELCCFCLQNWRLYLFSSLLFRRETGMFWR